MPPGPHLHVQNHQTDPPLLGNNEKPAQSIQIKSGRAGGAGRGGGGGGGRAAGARGGGGGGARATRYCARRYRALAGCTGRGLPLLQHTPAIAALLVAWDWASQKGVLNKARGMLFHQQCGEQ